jgi:CMP-N,N'-diacetyllegionaminic acid synthase
MGVLGLVPARGGSKGISRKNARPLGGRPLIVWTIEAALAADGIDQLVVSTDDEEIAEIALAAGAEVPFLRPAELAADDTPTLPVVQHAVDAMAAAGSPPDAVCLLQPTSPFRADGLIDRCIDLLAGHDSVMTIKAIPTEHHPAWAYLRSDDGSMRLAMGGTNPVPRRQELAPAFCREGSVYVTTTRTIAAGSLYGPSVIGVDVDATSTVNLDTEADWDAAESLVAGSLVRRAPDR